MATKITNKLLKYLDSKDYRFRCAAAEHPDATPEILLKAIEDEDYYVRSCAALNPNFKKLKLPLEKWLQFVSTGIPAKCIPSWVKKDPRYKPTRILSKLAQSTET